MRNELQKTAEQRKTAQQEKTVQQKTVQQKTVQQKEQEGLLAACQTLERMNVLDDFMFWKLCSDPATGEAFCRSILKVILGRELNQIRIVPQRVYYGASPEKHGARLDVYIEEDGSAEAEPSTLFDIEAEKKYNQDAIHTLSRRVRFYHSKIDAEILDAGMDYRQLKRVMVIMILPYDPFRCNRMIYTIRNLCVEVPQIPYDDGAVTLFLYTKGTEGNPPEELRKLLRYMEDSKKENAEGELLQSIHQMVQDTKHKKEVTVEYMKIYERERMIREESKAEGIAEEQERAAQRIAEERERAAQRIAEERERAAQRIAEEQERATQRIAEEQERAIQLLTETFCEMNIPREEVAEKIMSKYGISREQAENCVKQYWKRP